MQFLKSNEIQLVKGYLVNKEEVPVFNQTFARLQIDAEEVIELVKELKGKDLSGRPETSISKVLSDVRNKIEKRTTRDYRTSVESPISPVTDSLKNEALEWIGHQHKVEAQDYINKDMQHFNYLVQFEEIGLHFDPGTIRLNKLYTIKEILEAITELNNNFQSQGISTLLEWNK